MSFENVGAAAVVAPAGSASAKATADKPAAMRAVAMRARPIVIHALRESRIISSFLTNNE
jgi:hypothetical protein